MSAQIQQASIQDVIIALPVSERVPIAAILNIQQKRQTVQEDEEKNIWRIKEKYKKLYQPLYARTAEILRGGVLVEAQVKQLSNILQKGQSMIKPSEDGKYKGKIIQQFWPSVLNNSTLAKFMKQTDQKALSYLLSVQVVSNNDLAVQQGVDVFTLKFVFKNTNPYFEETQVLRTLKIKGGMILCVEGQQVTWKQLGKSLRYQIKKVTNKKTGQTKTVPGKKTGSFFDIFEDQSHENAGDLERCAQILNTLANDIIGSSAEYFLGVIENDNEEDDFDEDEDQYEDEQGLEERNLPNKKKC